MGITKTEIFADEQNQLATAFKVLGHPARIAILQYIIDRKACICNDLVEELGLAQATISQHLKELKSTGIIQGTIEGKSVCYCINEAVWKRIQQDFNTFFNQEVKVSSCCP
ncbi:metalloregulator ArsR/SmtB family transcription factor [Sphingobacterium sp. InxBP1]|uniref:ArsR/SmtB family transcription factor n=1 Tax=Sphingobacterium sp. InxBP1 TaxID=2870328 RepID=UPI0022436E3A|nr:metalloregulator ArsR/SmtB family transcription factor [Sphingobacterium sp. InxBP1]MCW8313455.1 metalloregulator ArsR/SmtB family transcription factor [Sphingobacterium sp. InxBP1]